MSQGNQVPTATAPRPLVDIVDTREEAGRLEVQPLVIREVLRDALAAHDLPAVERIDAGHSNPTFRVLTERQALILRRPPRPPFEPTAHDVLREYRIMSGLRDQPVRAPVPVYACDDPTVMGAPFYLMEALDGIVLRGATDALSAPEERHRVGVELVDALAEMHEVDPGVLGLGDPARGKGYLERQVALWTGQWQRNQQRPVPALDEVARHLQSRLPATPRISLVHGDYKLDNVLFACDAPARLVAILDWEMATIGDPLADLGFLTATWIDHGEPTDRVAGLSTVSAQPGFPTRRELAARYAQDTGLPLDDLAWYQALALWKLAILLEASYGRFLSGTASDPFFPTLEQGVPRIAEQALDASAGALI